MHLKMRRSQRSAGMVNKKIYFALDAQADLTPEEFSLVQKYALGNTVVYDSEARKTRAEAVQDHLAESRETSGGRALWKVARGVASAAMAALTLRITVGSLVSGQHIECKDLDELLGAEAAILEGCRNLKAYLETAVTFDGREEVLEF